MSLKWNGGDESLTGREPFKIGIICFYILTAVILGMVVFDSFEAGMFVGLVTSLLVIVFTT